MQCIYFIFNSNNELETFLALFMSFLILLENILNGVYEESDIIKVREDSRFVELYLKHNKGDVDKAVKFMHTSLEWRKSFGVKSQLCIYFETFMMFSNCDLQSNGEKYS